MNKFYTSSLVWVWNVAVILFIQILGTVIEAFLPDFKNVISYVVMIAIQLSSIAVVLIVTKKSKVNYFTRIQKPTLKNLLLTVGIALATFFGMYLIAQHVFELIKLTNIEIPTLETDNGLLVLTIISTVIFAPIGEEAVFRLVGCSAFDDKHAYLAVIFSAITFTFMHMSPLQTFFQIVLGVVLSVVYVRTKNILYPVILHATSNLVSVCFSLILEALNVKIPYFNVIVVILAFVILLVAAFLVVLMIKKLDKFEHAENDIDNGIIENSKSQKVFGIIAYVTGFVVCLAIWLSPFFTAA